MADAVQPTQRNLYRGRVAGIYRDGSGTVSLNEWFLWSLSNAAQIAQKAKRDQAQPPHTC